MIMRRVKPDGTQSETINKLIVLYLVINFIKVEETAITLEFQKIRNDVN